MELRKIIHVDMDAFYASVEQRDDPALRGRPVIVGGSPNSRGVVSACSYEARKFGIHSAMASSKAYRLCPQAIFVRPHFDVYEQVSAQIRGIFCDYTDLVEPLSLDEAYLDVTANKIGSDSATAIAREIQERILAETGLSASAGVSYNKFLAKVASDYRKPHGLTVVRPEQAEAFIDALPIGRFYGVGKVTEKAMIEMGINNGADLRRIRREDLVAIFGRSGDYFYGIARGIDERPVEPNHVRKSVGREITLAVDIDLMDEILVTLDRIAADVAEMLRECCLRGRTVTLKVKYFDFTQSTRSATIREYTNEMRTIFEQSVHLLRFTEAGRKKIRLLGISVSNLDNETGCAGEQLVFPFYKDKQKGEQWYE